MTNGRWTSPSSNDFPQNRPRARTRATRMPGIRLVVIAQKATRKLRRTAVTSSGERCSNSAIRHVSPLLEEREPVLLQDRPGGGRPEKGDIARGAGICRNGHRRDRIDNGRMGVLWKGA